MVELQCVYSCVRVKEGIKRRIVSVDHVEKVCGEGTVIHRQYVGMTVCEHVCAEGTSAHIYTRTCVRKELAYSLCHCVRPFTTTRERVCGLECVRWQGAFLTEQELDS